MVLNIDDDGSSLNMAIDFWEGRVSQADVDSVARELPSILDTFMLDSKRIFEDVH